MNIPIPDRYDFALFAKKYFLKTGHAAEIGVFEGEFSAHNLNEWMGRFSRYWMIDTWAHRPDGTTDKNDVDADYWQGVKEKAIQNTEFANGYRSIVQGDSVSVAREFANEKFDWIFIDAGHDYRNCINDLRAWWTKLRPGGLFSGDDYGIGVEDVRMAPLTPERYESKFGGIAKAYNWGTASALHEFCQETGAKLNITWMNDQHNPAWYIVK